MYFKYLLLLPAMFASVVLSRAAETEPVREFGFSSMEAFKFSSRTDSLLTSDINGDGLDDIIFADNGSSRIELLLRRKSPKDPNGGGKVDDYFENAGFFVNFYVRYIDFGDFDGDGKTDIIACGQKNAEIFFQEKDSHFSSPERVISKQLRDISGLETWPGKITGGKTRDSIMISSDKLALVVECNKQRKIDTITQIPYSGSSCSYFLFDKFLNTTDNQMLIYLKNEQEGLRLKNFKSANTYGWEIPVKFDIACTFSGLKEFPSPIPMGMILRSRKVFSIYSFESETTGKLRDMQEVYPYELPIEDLGKGPARQWLLTDLNNDGFKDLVVAAPELSRLNIYDGQADGFAAIPREIQTLADISKIARDKHGNIYVLSVKEKMLARHLVGRITEFPQVLKLNKAPLAFDLIGNEVYVAEKKDKKFVIAKYSWTKDGKIADSQSNVLDLRVQPRDLRMVKVGAKQRALIVFPAYEKPKAYRYVKGKIVEFVGLTRNLPALLAPELLLQTTWKGDDAILICTKRMARIYQLKNEQIKIVEQFNPPEKNYDFKGVLEGPTFYAMWDITDNRLLIFPKDSKNSKSAQNNRECITLMLKSSIRTLRGMEFFSANGKGGIVMLEKNKLLQLRDNQKLLKFKERAKAYQDKNDKTIFRAISSVRLGNPEKPYAVLFNTHKGALEFFTITNGKLWRTLKFSVFSKSTLFSRRTDEEPHDIASGDINGDRIPDLVLLCHDRLLIYFGE